MVSGGRIVVSQNRHGFAIAEVVVALFFVTMAIVLVGGLGQQVANFAKRSSQTGAILELRNMSNSITRNTEGWLNSMRSSQHTNGIFAGCIPDPQSNIATYSCPAVDSKYLQDADLFEISEKGTYQIVSAPLVNSSGDLIAGSENSPIFYTSEGRLCETSNSAQCPLKSTGYFLRSNSNTNQDPGSVKFVIKVERNQRNVASNSTPMKAQYITMDIGDDWKKMNANFGGTCPANTIKVGYLSTGKPSCINPTAPCSNSSQMAIGLNANGTPICKALPDCSSSGGNIVLNQAGNDLVCSTASPCGPNTLFLGYFAGSGQPMCSSSSIKCPTGQVQVGTKISAGNITAECEALPNCNDANQRLSFNGTKFECTSAAVVMSCADNEVMSGINGDGTPNCVSRTPASIERRCAAGKYVAGLDASDNVICENLPTGGSSASNYLDTFQVSDGAPWLSGGAAGVIPPNSNKLITVPIGNADIARGYIGTSYLDTQNSFDWHANFTFKKSTGEFQYSMSGLHWAKSGTFNVNNSWKAFATDFGENPYNGATTASYPAAPAAKAYRVVEVFFDSASSELKLKLAANWYRIDTYQVVVDKFSTQGASPSGSPSLSEHKVGISQPATKNLGAHKICYINQSNGSGQCSVTRVPISDNAAPWTLRTEDPGLSCGAVCSD